MNKIKRVLFGHHCPGCGRRRWRTGEHHFMIDYEKWVRCPGCTVADLYG